MKTSATALALAMTMLVASASIPTAAAQAPHDELAATCADVGATGLPPVGPTGDPFADLLIQFAQNVSVITIGATSAICYHMADLAQSPGNFCRILVGDVAGICTATDPFVEFAVTLADLLVLLVEALLDSACGIFLEHSPGHTLCVIATNPEMLLPVAQILIEVVDGIATDVAAWVNEHANATEQFAMEAVAAAIVFINAMLDSTFGFLNERVAGFNDLVLYIMDLVIALITGPA